MFWCVENEDIYKSMLRKKNYKKGVTKSTAYSTEQDKSFQHEK